MVSWEIARAGWTMAKIEWNASFSLGVKSLDSQQRRLIELAAGIFQSVKNKQDYRLVSALFSKLRQHTVYHFNDEEEFMRSMGYPEIKAHAKEHDDIKSMLRQHQEQLFREGRVREKDIREFQKKLLVEHVVYSDLNVKRFLSANTLQKDKAPAA
jgi:hemerythrin-like metal-binding protein